MLSFYLRAAVITLSLMSFGVLADSQTTSGFPYTYSGCYIPSAVSNWGDWVDECTASASNRYCAVVSGCASGKQSVKYRTSPPECPEGEIWEEGTTNCIDDPEAPPPDPECPADHEYSNGLCLPNYPPEQCENVVGYISGEQVCGDAADECASQGGALGQVNGQTVCVPEEESPPTCSGSGLVTIIEEGYVCEPTTDNQNGTNNDNPTPNSEGSNPNTDVSPENPDNPDNPDVDADSIVDSLEAQKETVKEQQEANTNLRKLVNQLADVNEELDTQSGFDKRAEDAQKERDLSRTMPDHTTNTVTSFSDANTDFMNQLNATALVSGFASFANIVPDTGGQCPVLSIDLTGTLIGSTVGTDLHCTLLEEVGGTIYAVMLVVWAWVGFRVVSRA